MNFQVSWDDVLETWGVAEREYAQAVASSMAPAPMAPAQRLLPTAPVRGRMIRSAWEARA